LAVRIRLRRLGAKKRPTYRLVATDSRKARDGRFIETLGYYNPIEKPATIKIHEDRVVYWLNQGAQLSDTTASLLTQIGFTLKYEMLKKGQDVSEITIKGQITERIKKRKKTKQVAEVQTEGKTEEKSEAATEAPAKADTKTESE